MVERQLPKLDTRVRSPSPAYILIINLLHDSISDIQNINQNSSFGFRQCPADVFFIDATDLLGPSSLTRLPRSIADP